MGISPPSGRTHRLSFRFLHLRVHSGNAVRFPAPLGFSRLCHSAADGFSSRAVSCTDA